MRNFEDTALDIDSRADAMSIDDHERPLLEGRHDWLMMSKYCKYAGRAGRGKRSDQSIESSFAHGCYCEMKYVRVGHIIFARMRR